MEIAIDFDGTCVKHEYPIVGADIGAIPVLKELVKQGHKLILFTMRSGIQLDDAIDWFMTNKIHLYGVQFNPTQSRWTNSNKCYAQLYIDDAALGMPLLNEGERDFVDWKKVEQMLMNKSILKQNG